MSFNLSLLFGNIDQEGKLDNEDLDDSFRDTLENADPNALSQLLGTSFDLGEDDGKDDTQSSTDKNPQLASTSDAIDYSDFNELADEVQNLKNKNEAEPIKNEINILNNFNNTANLGIHEQLHKTLSFMSGDDVDYDEEEDNIENKPNIKGKEIEVKTENKTEDSVKIKKENEKENETEVEAENSNKTSKPSITTFYPEFEKGKILKFSELFSSMLSTVTKPIKKELQASVIDEYYDVEPDDRIILQQPLIPPQLLKKELEAQQLLNELAENKSETSSQNKEEEEKSESEESNFESDESSNEDNYSNKSEQSIQIYTGNFRPIVLEDWDKEILWDDSDTDSAHETKENKIE